MKTIKHSSTLTEYVHEESEGTKGSSFDTHLTDEDKDAKTSEIIGVPEEDE